MEVQENQHPSLPGLPDAVIELLARGRSFEFGVLREVDVGRPDGVEALDELSRDRDPQGVEAVFGDEVEQGREGPAPEAVEGHVGGLER